MVQLSGEPFDNSHPSDFKSKKLSRLFRGRSDV